MDLNFLSNVVGIVEATSYERMCLWKDNKEGQKRVWIENPSGYMPTIGYINERPVVLSLITAEIDGHKILFVDPCSVLVDWQMVEDWLTENLPVCAITDSGYLNRVDAMNFHNVFPRG